MLPGAKGTQGRGKSRRAPEELLRREQRGRNSWLPLHGAENEGLDGQFQDGVLSHNLELAVCRSPKGLRVAGDHQETQGLSVTAERGGEKAEEEEGSGAFASRDIDVKPGFLRLGETREQRATGRRVSVAAGSERTLEEVQGTCVVHESSFHSEEWERSSGSQDRVEVGETLGMFHGDLARPTEVVLASEQRSRGGLSKGDGTICSRGDLAGVEEGLGLSGGAAEGERGFHTSEGFNYIWGWRESARARFQDVPRVAQQAVLSATFGGLLFITILLATSPWTGEDWAPSPSLGPGWRAMRYSFVVGRSHFSSTIVLILAPILTLSTPGLLGLVIPH